mmetsp:Transcript_9493/g.23207  ORF Transcript_9493/g.23207 Transcript_9493/m.23207 type:complete len:246 (+) Transcript_9493:320-1057(+)
MFWILNSVNRASKPSFWMMRAYFREASRAFSSLFAPVHTIFPEPKMSAVVLGSRMRMMTAANLRGLYSALRACKAIFLRSRWHARFTVATMFWRVGMISASAVSSASEAAPAATSSIACSPSAAIALPHAEKLALFVEIPSQLHARPRLRLRRATFPKQVHQSLRGALVTRHPLARAARRAAAARRSPERALSAGGSGTKSSPALGNGGVAAVVGGNERQGRQTAPTAVRQERGSLSGSSCEGES